MSGLFGKPKQAKMPPAMSPVATPVKLDEEVLEKDRARRRQRIVAAGRQGTIIAGGLGTSNTGRTTLLGGTA